MSTKTITIRRNSWIASWVGSLRRDGQLFKSGCIGVCTPKNIYCNYSKLFMTLCVFHYHPNPTRSIVLNVNLCCSVNHNELVYLFAYTLRSRFFMSCTLARWCRWKTAPSLSLRAETVADRSNVRIQHRVTAKHQFLQATHQKWLHRFFCINRDNVASLQRYTCTQSYILYTGCYLLWVRFSHHKSIIMHVSNEVCSHLPIHAALVFQTRAFAWHPLWQKVP